jgi:hypothetical protein
MKVVECYLNEECESGEYNRVYNISHFIKIAQTR